MAHRLSSLRVYKFDVPYNSDVGVILVTSGLRSEGCRFPLTRYTGQAGRDSEAGLSQSFVDLVAGFFEENSINITDQIFAYLSSNFSFKHLVSVPPACPVLVFHFHTRQSHLKIHELDTSPYDVMELLRLGENIMSFDNVEERLVRIAPATSEIVDCYREPELCSLCGGGYPKAEEIAHKTVCNHVFHGACISSHLLNVPHCPVCWTRLPPVDIRTLLF
ncbi:unnamed protein product [Microthlaspi erraticum]|uniref:RING-type domain-containing protein n=1 Tax=Microthlaspi erraticum TaxID=1685480 RepID=A0A6D2J9D9_9BRAS|nr:unnamed protein product [Microthlaspi erraticum]